MTARANTTSDKDSDTKKRIFAAAKRVLARNGPGGTSLRDITGEADVNVAAVSYYFGSKESLEEEVFERIAKAANKKRTSNLKAYIDSLAADERPSTDRIIRIFVEPYLADGEEVEGLLLARLIVHHRLSPSERTLKVSKTYFDPMAKLFVKALARAAPDTPEEEMFWRYEFMSNAVVMALCAVGSANRIERISGGRVDRANQEEFRRALMRFLQMGLGSERPEP
ncbi:TetR family transcriptional regulator [Pseudooceanicola sp. 216_PA32_1]|uniref:TetR family transcriptional regulator n=1 Tax=Pseudooceanicola pacificus TaxID=2676438 RepID=A0A844W616_9RHOB|nr:TetR/AcrR family transcriptional regulator [Pseudooceanicola pacificus]MWB78261.1 TetR family transcriptional regulator [Pseudooceanicola pacificus]